MPRAGEPRLLPNTTAHGANAMSELIFNFFSKIL
jgi:hypothetical protein